MRALFIYTLAATALHATLGCAVRDEIIATVPADGGSGGDGGAGGTGPVLTLAQPVEHPLNCGEAEEVAVGDVDGDGAPDVLVGGDCLTVFRGDGEGALGGADSPVTSGFGAAFALGYVDSTHPLTPTDPIDLVAFSQPIQVYIGDGSGAFQMHTSVDAGPPGQPGTIALVNLFADDALELVTTTGNELSWWTGDGTGTFVGPHATTLGSPITAVSHGELDGDAHTDFLVITGDGVSLLRNNAAGDFATPVGIANTSGMQSVVLADLDGDNCLDAVAIDGRPGAPGSNDGAVIALRNDCAGAFQAEIIASLTNAVAVAVADLDGDGAVDVVVARAGAEPAILTARGQGDGSFAAFDAHLLQQEPGRLVIVDLDNDARPDIVVTHHGASAVVTLRNETP